MDPAECSTGAVRLVDDSSVDSGRLEICLNNAWGTVCSDDFDTSDASVACGTLEGFTGSGKQVTILMYRLRKKAKCFTSDVVLSFVC